MHNLCHVGDRHGCLFALLKRGGSHPGRAANLNRDFQSGHDYIYQDYFSDNPVYPASLFRRRFRMRREIFMRIHNSIVSFDNYFVQKADALGNMGFLSLQKITASLVHFVSRFSEPLSNHIGNS